MAEMIMNIILNFIPLKRGGGVQVGLDFIIQLNESSDNHNWYLVATEGTPFSHFKETAHLRRIKIIRNNYISRFIFEMFECKKLIKEWKADVIYTQFGPQWNGIDVLNVVGCAYSNLMYPELDFWDKLPLHQWIVKNAIDWYRRKKMLKADVLIFETENLAMRARNLYSLTAQKVCCVKPCASSLVRRNQCHPETSKKFADVQRGFRVLLLSGYHSNKNFELLPKILKVLAGRHGVTDLYFLITVSDRDKGPRAIFRQAAALRVEGNLINVGPIPYEGCIEAYRACDAVILPSRLESFSNTIAESWEMHKPLFISDFDWSRSICGDGAIYFRYDDAEDAAVKLLHLRDDPTLAKNIVQRGEEMLKSYPSSKERFGSYLKIMEESVAHDH